MSNIGGRIVTAIRDGFKGGMQIYPLPLLRNLKRHILWGITNLFYLRFAL